MTRGRLRDLVATCLREHEDIGEVSNVRPSVGDTVGLHITAIDRQRYRLWIANDHGGGS